MDFILTRFEFDLIRTCSVAKFKHDGISSYQAVFSLLLQHHAILKVKVIKDGVHMNMQISKTLLKLSPGNKNPKFMSYGNSPIIYNDYMPVKKRTVCKNIIHVFNNYTMSELDPEQRFHKMQIAILTVCCQRYPEMQSLPDVVLKLANAH